MFTARELKVRKRYRVPTNRAFRLGPCSTLTRKRHLANGTRYALTFDNGKKRRWQFYNFTDKPVFKSCQTRRRHPGKRWSFFGPIVSWAAHFENRLISSRKKKRPLVPPCIKHHIIIMLFCTLSLVRHLSFQRSAIRVTLITSVRILRQIPVPLTNHNIFGRHPIIRFVAS